MRNRKRLPVGSVGGLSVSACLRKDTEEEERARQAVAEERNQQLAECALAQLARTQGRRD